jgi:hypothetical protein
MIRRKGMMRKRMAHAYGTEYLVVHQLFATQRHRDALALVLDEFAVIMPEEDAQNERE